LHAAGADSFLITPLYDQVDRSLLNGTFIDDLEVEWRGKRPLVRVWQSDALKAPTYLIDAPFYFERGKIYGEANDFERFAFFSRAAIALLRRLGEAPDIVHCNDWPCGFATVELRARRRVVEIPVSYYPRVTGESKHSDSYWKISKTATRMLKTIFAKRFLR